jgi:anaerobic selenocysteine-containing dehydrogenase
MQTHYKTCPICEATCGLEITTKEDKVILIKGDEQDVFSGGYICPKGYSLKELHEDADRLRQPLIRRGDMWHKVSWDEAFEEIERGLLPVIQKYGRNAVGAYIGNPNAHNLAGMMYGQVWLKSLGTQNIFSASTVDQMPKQVSSGLMFGGGITVPVPDIDRTDYLLLLGANPLVSNGSLMTAPDMRGRIRKLRARGGKLVVIDPFRTQTAKEADEHHFIKPGTDAHFLFGMVHVLFAEGLVKPAHLADHLDGLDKVYELSRQFSPEKVAPICGVSPEVIRKLARELAQADKAVVYGRIGTCTQEFGTLASWLVDVLNILTGNLDKEGGAMFTKAAVIMRGGGKKGVRFGRWKSRVRGLPEFFGELPVVCLAEEILTPGDGQIRAMITAAGNPILSNPSGNKLEEAFASLEFMVSVDIYLNETTRHANVILPPPSALERSHYDVALYRLAVRNVANFSQPVFARPENQPDEWEILCRLAALLNGQGAHADPQTTDDFHIRQIVEREMDNSASPIHGRSTDEILELLKPNVGHDRILDFLLRVGNYGDGFGKNPDGLSLAKLIENPHGVDLGALTPQIPQVLNTPSGKIEMAHTMLVNDVERLQQTLERSQPEMLLIGRRDLRSNNSWMHNLNVLVKGKNRCTLRIHPQDAVKLGLEDGELAMIASKAGEIHAPIEVTDGIMPGVVSLPHGWGHSSPAMQMQIAFENAGVNSNILADTQRFDPLSGNAILNGIAVTVRKTSQVLAAV